MKSFRDIRASYTRCVRLRSSALRGAEDRRPRDRMAVYGFRLSAGHRPSRPWRRRPSTSGRQQGITLPNIHCSVPEKPNRRRQPIPPSRRRGKPDGVVFPITEENQQPSRPPSSRILERLQLGGPGALRRVHAKSTSAKASEGGGETIESRVGNEGRSNSPLSNSSEQGRRKPQSPLQEHQLPCRRHEPKDACAGCSTGWIWSVLIEIARRSRLARMSDILGLMQSDASESSDGRVSAPRPRGQTAQALSIPKSHSKAVGKSPRIECRGYVTSP